jgi:transcriptional regulator with XRE-family HTH domain
MSDISLRNIGPALRTKRGDRGLREVAREIKISPATLARIEAGNLPDIETFTKICSWMELDAGVVLGTTSKVQNTLPLVHLKAKKNLSEKAAKALSATILLTAEMLPD